MRLIEQLLTVSRAYLGATDVKPTTLSWRLFDDTSKLAALEAGAGLEVKRFERAMGWLSANWPDGAEWPADVSRPSADADAA